MSWNLSLISGPWPVPMEVPVFISVDCTALSFSDEESVKIPLATYWENTL